MYRCGIDWSIEKLDLSVIDENEQEILSFTVENNLNSYIEALSILQKLEDFPLIEFAIEDKHQHIVEFLLRNGFSVFLVNPNNIRNYRKSISISGCQSDSLDAFLIARYLKSNKMLLQPIQKDSPSTERIRIIEADRDILISQENRLVNQLKATLRVYYPQALLFFSDITCPSALDFLELYPTIDDLRNADSQEIKDFLSAHHCYSQKKISSIKKAMEQKSSVDEITIECKKHLMITLVKQLKIVKKQIKKYEALLSSLLSEHQDAPWVLSLPGVSTVLACKIISRYGDDRTRFGSYNDVQAISGTAPVTVQSGKYRNVHFRTACNKRFRDTMHKLAFCSLNECEWALMYYRRKRDEGKTHHHALRCLANIWVKIVYTLWKKRECYSEEKRLASIGKHALTNS